jgi:hypothetical protein
VNSAYSFHIILNIEFKLLPQKKIKYGITTAAESKNIICKKKKKPRIYAVRLFWPWHQLSTMVHVMSK